MPCCYTIDEDKELVILVADDRNGKKMHGCVV
jgi:hypothetical protein